MSKVDYNYKERIDEFVFKKNWIEPPLYHNNDLGKTLRFNLESKSEMDNAKLIENIFNDVFYDKSSMFVVFYGSKHWRWQSGKKYFNFLSLKKILKKNFDSKDDNYDKEDNRYLTVCLTQKNNFKFKKYLSKYFKDQNGCQMAFISLKKGVALQLYDSRGFDLLSVDKDFLINMYSKYQKDILEFNREEIIMALQQ